MSEIKNVGKTWMTKCNHLTCLPFKGLKDSSGTSGEGTGDSGGEFEPQPVSTDHYCTETGT